MTWVDITYRIVLFGHRDFDGHKTLDERLYPLLCDLILNNPFVEIYVGRNGEFDVFAASVVKRVQRKLGKDNNELSCVLPYHTKDTEHLEHYYDRIIIPECVVGSHPKSAITKRNRWMVEQADLFICYLERDNGGAYSAMKYAKKLNKRIINLSDSDI